MITSPSAAGMPRSPVHAFLRGAAYLGGFALSACLGTDSSFDMARPQGAWDFRLVSEGDSHAIYYYLDSATGRIALECSYWDRKGNCTDGWSNHRDAAGGFAYSVETVDGDTTSPRPFPGLEFAPDGKILARHRFEAGTSKVTFTDRYRYDDAGRLAAVLKYADFLGGDLTEEWTFTYGAGGRLDTVSTRFEPSGAVWGYRYAYDSAGRLAGVTSNIGSGAAIERDAGGRVAKVVRTQYGGGTTSRVEFRIASGTYEPDPVKDLFMTSYFFP
jgi:YD repeat-containing protein